MNISIVKYDRIIGNPFTDNLSAPGFKTKYIPNAMKNGCNTPSKYIIAIVSTVIMTNTFAAADKRLSNRPTSKVSTLCSMCLHPLIILQYGTFKEAYFTLLEQNLLHSHQPLLDLIVLRRVMQNIALTVHTNGRLCDNPMDMFHWKSIPKRLRLKLGQVF